ncbi:putative O-antigen biosynthesis glycosyltransferase WbnK [Hyphomicrobiales bacterium]|nr:putative O-antigen biosynthesis glycosyltransferase WbnK [Hyphomicrobiales bacterium]CAH1698134.1 putative O-antigen biosynthesis glycosyltransferase WbnK [Hyphomicrobiales bacterium]CAI0347777.1 putative O-antigen biosynthesis glycosyltransferase WbnK [Hyphomicrobiales bacterium]
MITTRIIGGLGNQMFQYAAGRALALRNRTGLAIDRSAFMDYTVHAYALDFFVLEAPAASASDLPASPGAGNRLSRLLPWRRPVRHVVEQGLRFDPAVAAQSGNVYLDGYWQSEQYFSDFSDILRKDFRFRHAPSPTNAEFLKRAGADNTVSIHIRRGDYVTNPNALAVHGTCSPAYYEKAITTLAKECGSPLVGFVFSDDHAWAHENIRLPIETVHVEGNAADKAYEDMRIMAACRHHVIANSTFSWWGAWLDPRPDSRVIAPARWFADTSMDATDLIPERWKRLQVELGPSAATC